MVVLFLVMGVAPNLWLRTIDTVASPMASRPAAPSVNANGLVGQISDAREASLAGGAR